MINKYNFFHGVVLFFIINYKKCSILPYNSKSNCSYIINGNIGIYIKHSEKRMSPWRFSFLKEHQDEILEIKKKIKKVYIIFVCKDDGIVCLNFNELKMILDNKHDEIEWIAISRGKKEKYKVSGSDGKLGYKIGNNEFPKKIFNIEKDNIILNFFK